MSQKLNYQVDNNKLANKLIEEICGKLDLCPVTINHGVIEFPGKLSKEKLEDLKERLGTFGFMFIEDIKGSFVHEIKSAIDEMLNESEDTPSVKTSVFLEQKLHKSYSSIARSFKEETYMSVENYIILQKVEMAKQMMISDQYTLTEIAHRLRYSSVAHLSNQFKKTTGLSASAFVRILNKRKELIKIS